MMDLNDVQFEFHDARHGGLDEIPKDGAADLALQLAGGPVSTDGVAGAFSFSESLASTAGPFAYEVALEGILAVFQPGDQSSDDIA